MLWIEYDVAEREQWLANLLACVRLPLLKPQYLTDKVASNELIRGSLRCRDLVDEAKDYHLMPERRPLLHTFRSLSLSLSLPLSLYHCSGKTEVQVEAALLQRYSRNHLRRGRSDDFWRLVVDGGDVRPDDQSLDDHRAHVTSLSLFSCREADAVTDDRTAVRSGRLYGRAWAWR